MKSCSSKRVKELRRKRNSPSIPQIFLLLILALFLTSCASPPPEDSLAVTLFHTNDHHGRSLAYLAEDRHIGGLAERITLIKSLREKAAAKGDFCILLDAGDISSGTMFSDSFSAEPDWKVYGKYYDAVTPGNHDFDFPLDGMVRFIEQFEVPVISANIIDRRTGSLLFPPYKIFRHAGWSIVVIGISHPETPILSTLGNDQRLEFRSATEAAASYVDQLREQHDMVILLSHLGKDDRLAREVKGIDLIIGGHSHSPFPKPLKRQGVLIVNAGYGGQYVGQMSLLLKRKGRGVEIELTHYELIPVTADIPPDNDVVSILQPYLDAFGDQGGTVVGHAGESFSRESLADSLSSSNLSHLVADSYRSATGADFAFVNEGGLRADLEKGPLTVDDLHAVLPFNNTLIVFELRGSQVMEVIRNMVSGLIGKNGILFPSNLRITNIQSGIPEVQTGNGDSLVLDKIYSVAVGSFIARGGDGHQSFPKFEKKRDTMIRTSNALRKYIEAKKTVFPDNIPRLK